MIKQIIILDLLQTTRNITAILLMDYLQSVLMVLQTDMYLLARITIIIHL